MYIFACVNCLFTYFSHFSIKVLIFLLQLLSYFHVRTLHSSSVTYPFSHFVILFVVFACDVLYHENVVFWYFLKLSQRYQSYILLPLDSCKPSYIQIIQEFTLFSSCMENFICENIQIVPYAFISISDQFGVYFCDWCEAKI